MPRERSRDEGGGDGRPRVEQQRRVRTRSARGAEGRLRDVVLEAIQRGERVAQRRVRREVGLDAGLSLIPGIGEGTRYKFRILGASSAARFIRPGRNV